MNPEVSTPTALPTAPPATSTNTPASTNTPVPLSKVRTPLRAHGEPMVWLAGGALVLCVCMILGLLILVLIQGAATFWPGSVVEIKTRKNGTYLGEPTRHETYQPTEETLKEYTESDRKEIRAQLDKTDGSAERTLYRTGNFNITKTHFTWVSDFEVVEESKPEWALVIERVSYGRFYGYPAAFIVEDGNATDEVTTEPKDIWQKFNDHHEEVRERYRKRVKIEKHDLGEVRRKENDARLKVRSAELRHGVDSTQYRDADEEYSRVKKWAAGENERITEEINRLNRENARYKLRMRIADGTETDLLLADIVRAYPANRLSTTDKLGVYFSRWWEFLSDDPREANSEGGVFPALFGTVAMTLLMSLAVVPFGVIAAVHLREYAKSGPIISAVRIAINNLAGVPSIVFGVFGLGFFCQFLGGRIDLIFYQAELPNPTFGTGGILWASLTLALLTLPVVIVATEEALAAVPNSMREGSYACGASKWQTIWRIVLPRAMPGILTGMILAMARGAGEVAPLMLVGAMKTAQELPIDQVPPFVHPSRSFMHLGFHIFDVGFQSQNSEAGKPMVYTTTLLLIAIIAALNLAAVVLRARLRKRYHTSKF